MSDRAQRAPLESTEAQYRDVLQRLGVQGHFGAVEEIARLRARAGLEQRAPLTLLEQIDLEASPDYRAGYEAGRLKGYEVGHRHGVEHARMIGVERAHKIGGNHA